MRIALDLRGSNPSPGIALIMAIIALSSVFCSLKCEEAEVLASLARLILVRDVDKSMLAVDTIVTKIARAPHIIARYSIMVEISFHNR